MSNDPQSADARGAHGAILTIDTGAVVANWKRLGQEAPQSECGAVVKANAYGLGTENIVPALASAGCRTFFVAHVDEGVAARKAAPAADIYILNGLPARTTALYAEHRLRPVLGSLAEVDEWTAFVSASGISGEAALHLETGMHRLGFAGAELETVTSRFATSSLGFPVTLVMSHFVSADEPHSLLNAGQIAAFNALRSRFPNVPASLANSSGIFLGAKAHFDLLRPGYALYGGNPTPGRDNPMRPVVTLEAEMLQVRDLHAGETVGYNATWTAKSPRRVAVISVGYADGYLRSASGTDETPGGMALVGGVACPIAGRVSMDLIVVDVTDAPAQEVARGRPVTLIGGELTVDVVGRRAGTIGYEVLTSLGRRYRPRIIA